MSSALFYKKVVDPRPLAYSPPKFPSLYWPFPVGGAQTTYIYDADTMWDFTLYWCLICIVAVHVAAAGYACAMQPRNWKLMWLTPVIYAIVGGIEALIAGSLVGGLLAGIYTAGFFRMSTWIPLAWGITCAIALILSSFAIQGGL